MSEIKVNKITPRVACGTTQLGDSGDTFTLPSGATMTVASGGTITNSGTASGFGATGAVSWDTSSIKTAGFTATTGIGYFCNTTGGIFTVTLPSSPSAGAVVGVSDYAKTFDTNNLTLGRNGSNISGTASDATASTEGMAITLVYVDATKGWIVTDSGNQTDIPTALFVTATGGTPCTGQICGDYKVHAFTGPGTFIVSCAGNPSGSATMEVMTVAGGGGGGGNEGGGGGAGGLILQPSFTAAATPYAIAIGGGGNGGTAGSITSGANSTGFCFTSVGGGHGGYGSGTPNSPSPAPWGVESGGSGGGGQRNSGAGAAGTQGPGMPGPTAPLGFGFAGQIGGGPYGGGGGGGASEAGGTDDNGAGGDGKDISPTFGTAPQPFYLTDSPSSAGPVATGIFAGGGSGAYKNCQGGDGGGGFGAPPSSAANADAAITNSGGGGGGGAGGGGGGGNGGSGIVLIRYKFQ